MIMKLAAVGSNCIDYYDNIDNGKPCPGGGPVNMGVYTVAMGGEASYIGPVGTDEYGKIMIEAIKGKGLDVTRLVQKEGKTAVSNVSLIDGERVFGEYDEGVLAEYVLSEDDMDFIATHDVVVCDLWGKVEGQYKDLQERGIKTAFDGATRPEDEACIRALPYTDYFFFSTDTDEGDSEELRNKLKDYYEKGPELVIAMLGEKGSLCYDGENFHSFGIIPCDNLVDTMGAGDSYIAGFLFGIIENKTIEEAMKMGAERATETLQYFGAWE